MKLNPPETAPLGVFILLFDGFQFFAGYRIKDQEWPYIFIDEKVFHYIDDNHPCNAGAPAWCQGWLPFPDPKDIESE